jgi:hypothetical protein
MTDAEAIEVAKRYGLPIVSIPPKGVIDEIITVDLRDRNRPIVTRRASSDFGPPRS